MSSIIFRKYSSMSTLIKPPIQVFGVYGRYANALYSAAMKTKTVDIVEKDLIKLQAVIMADKKINDFIQNKGITKKIKVAGIKVVAEKLGLTTETSNLLQLMAENGRLSNFKSLFDNYKEIMMAHRKEVKCEIVAAEELSPQDYKELETSLQSFLTGEQKLVINLKIDPSIIGGLIVSVGDHYADMSIAAKIKKYKAILSVPVYK